MEQTGGPSETATRSGHLDDPRVRAFVQASYVELFLSQSRRAQAGMALSAGLIGWLWFDPQRLDAGRWWPLAWVGLALLVTGWRMLATDRLVRAVDSAQATARIAGLLAVNGVVMSLSVLGFPQMNVVERAAVTVVLTALGTASVATTSGWGHIFLAFAAPMQVAVALGWWLAPLDAAHRSTGLGLAVLELVFLAFLVGLGRQTRHVFEDSCRMRFAERGLNEQLQQSLARESEAHRAKTQFLAAASHDLRQPLHSMSVLVAALGLRDLDPRSREIAELLGTVNQTLSQQLDALLDISRLDAGSIKPETKAVRLDQLLATHHQTIAPVAQERGLRCTLQPLEAATVDTDPSLLMRIVANLSDNAIKYTPAGGELGMGLHREGQHACITVRDSGIGIPASEQDKVFREFYQVGNVERDRTKGLGLGLSIVQRLSVLLGAQVRLQSEPGRGTTVQLRLPLAATAVDTAAQTPRNRAVLQGLRVLVIDDEPQVLESMQLLLSELGCTVHTAAGTEEARAVAATTPLDAVLSDFRLRDADSGLQALQAVRERQPGVRATLITGDTAPERIRQAEAFGVPVLHKPVSAEALVQALGGTA